MENNVKEMLTNKGICYLKKDGKYLNIYHDRECKIQADAKRLNIPLFYKIAIYTTDKKSYKSVIREYFDDLKHENIRNFFDSRNSLENATQACGKPGGRIAYLLGLFCRYYDKLPRNINIVWQRCENCININQCGKKEKCGKYYGCGKGVFIPLDPKFNIETIPELRKKIKTEIFECPKL